MSDSVIPVTTALQAPRSVEFFGQQHWSGLPFLPPGDPPDPGIESRSLASPVLQADSLLQRQLTERKRKAKGTGLGQMSPLGAEPAQDPERPAELRAPAGGSHVPVERLHFRSSHRSSPGQPQRGQCANRTCHFPLPRLPCLLLHACLLLSTIGRISTASSLFLSCSCNF